jgi:imidazolonepropionase-like amidohydrolase
MTPNIRSLWVAAFVCLAASGAPSQAQPEASFRIASVRVFDGERVHENVGVAVEAGVIRAIGPDLARWNHLPVVDGGGGTLLPGLIDAHVHTRSADQLRQALRFGVTTVLDLGAVIEPQELLEIRAAANAARDMADLRVAGFLATARSQQERGGPTLPSNPQVATIEDASRFVESRRAEGADHLKIVLRGIQSASAGVPTLDEVLVGELVATAHANGLPAVAHVETLGDVSIALAGGVDVVTHVWRREGANPEMARRVVERGTFVMPALVVPDSFLPDARQGLLDDPRFRNKISAEIRGHLSPEQTYPLLAAAAAPIEQRRANVATQLAALRSLRDAGAKLVAGSDASHVSPVGFGISLHRELEILKDAGLSGTETLATATSNAADAFRLRDRGRIAVGLRADLVLVRGDPTTDILATRDIQRVWKVGLETR